MLQEDYSLGGCHTWYFVRRVLQTPVRSMRVTSTGINVLEAMTEGGKVMRGVIHWMATTRSDELIRWPNSIRS